MRCLCLFFLLCFFLFSLLLFSGGEGRGVMCMCFFMGKPHQMPIYLPRHPRVARRIARYLVGLIATTIDREYLI